MNKFRLLLFDMDRVDTKNISISKQNAKKMCRHIITMVSSLMAFLCVQVYASNIDAWSSANIGNITLPGSVNVNGQDINMQGAGFDIENASDDFFYVHQTVKGDFSIQVKVKEIEKTNRWAKGGIMARATLEADSPNVMIAYSAHEKMVFQRRVTPGDDTKRFMSSMEEAEIRIKLERTANVFSSYYSVDNSVEHPNWILYRSKEIELPETLYVGLAASPHQIDANNHVLYSQLQYDFPNNPPPAGNIAKVYLMAGQSNMEGFGHNSELPFTSGWDITAQRDDVFIQNVITNNKGVNGLKPGYGVKYNKFGVELKLGNVLGDVLDETVYLFKGAKGGTSVVNPAHWRPQAFGGDNQNYYAQFLDGFHDFKTNFLEKNAIPYEIAGFIWFQGYNDTFGNEYVYESHLEDLLSAIRIDLNMPELPIIITQINDNRGLAGDIVMAAQQSIADRSSNIELVYTADQRPYYHYGSDSYIVIGERIARAALQQLKYPTAYPDTFQVEPNQVLISHESVLDNDAGSILSVQLVEPPEFGTLTFETDGSFVYSPFQNFIGPDTFTYRPIQSGLIGNENKVTIWVRESSSPLIFHLTFDEFYHSDAIDSASGLITVDRGSPTQYLTSGKIGNAAYFDGLGYLQYMTRYPVYDFLNLSTDQDFSISLWIKPDSPITSEQILISNKYYYKKNQGFAITTTENGVGIQAYIGAYNHTTKVGSSTALYAGDTPLADGDWHHIAVTFGFSEGVARIFIDGNETGQKDISHITGDVNQYESGLGDGSGGGDGKSNAYIGLMDDVRFYNKKLTHNEVMTLFEQH